jgi:hypothetical protein
MTRSGFGLSFHEALTRDDSPVWGWGHVRELRAYKGWSRHRSGEEDTERAQEPVDCWLALQVHPFGGVSSGCSGAPPPFRRAGTLETPVMERRKTGRPSKGQRREVRARVPVSLFEALHTEAGRRGMTVNDLVGEHLAALVGVPYSPQEALSLSA